MDIYGVSETLTNPLNYVCSEAYLILFSAGIHLARVVQKVDNAIHRINHYPADSVVCFVNIYPLDSDLSGG